jgi:hypothetical protein
LGQTVWQQKTIVNFLETIKANRNFKHKYSHYSKKNYTLSTNAMEVNMKKIYMWLLPLHATTQSLARDLTFSIDDLFQDKQEPQQSEDLFSSKNFDFGMKNALASIAEDIKLEIKRDVGELVQNQYALFFKGVIREQIIPKFSQHVNKELIPQIQKLLSAEAKKAFLEEISQDMLTMKKNTQRELFSLFIHFVESIKEKTSKLEEKLESVKATNSKILSPHKSIKRCENNVRTLQRQVEDLHNKIQDLQEEFDDLQTQ